MATRKVRAKRFVECFMESFRIVDFLSLPVELCSAGFMAADVCANIRVAHARYLRALRPWPPRRPENIKGYYLNSGKESAFFALP